MTFLTVIVIAILLQLLTWPNFTLSAVYQTIGLRSVNTTKVPTMHIGWQSTLSVLEKTKAFKMGLMVWKIWLVKWQITSNICCLQRRAWTSLRRRGGTAVCITVLSSHPKISQGLMKTTQSYLFSVSFWIIIENPSIHLSMYTFFFFTSFSFFNLLFNYKNEYKTI